MKSAAELKLIFQDGWNIPQRVENYVRNVAHGEFDDAASRDAWCRCLQPALPAAGPLKILDVGTGPGVFACLYAQLGHECVGLDFSKRMLHEARRRTAELRLNCSFVFGDAEEPPFPPQSFDVVSSRHLLFNLPRPGVAVRRWTRLLWPGGKLILIGDEPQPPDRPSLAGFVRRRWDWCRRKLSGAPQPGWSPTPDYMQAVSQCPLFKHGAGAVRAVMEAAGLQDVQSYPTNLLRDARAANRAAAGTRRPHGGQPYILAATKTADD